MLNPKIIGNKIAEARKKINLSQATLAQQISISSQAVGKWERGESMPDIMMLNRLAEIFGVDLNYFSEDFSSEAVTLIHEKNDKSSLESLTIKPRKKFEWNWDMSRGNWVDADFSGLKNLKEKFSSSNMKNCKFMNSDLSELILERNNIEKCDFSGSDLRNSKILSSNLLNNQFNKSSFVDARLFKNYIGKCDFSEANFSGVEITAGFFESNTVNNTEWKFVTFKNTGISNMIFEGIMENCNFDNCAFFNVKFQNATILNTFFKYNRKFKKVQLINCKVDKITYAFLKNNQAILTDVLIVD